MNSAGVGRTGSYICIDHLVQEVKQRSNIDVLSTVTLLRNERCLMVQNIVCTLLILLKAY